MTRVLIALIVLIVLVALLAAQRPASDWTQWRGAESRRRCPGAL